MSDSQPGLAEAKAAVERGDKAHARTLLDELIFNEPGNEQAWQLLAELVDDMNEQIDCLQHVLAINPHNTAAQQKYDDLLRRFPELAELDPAKVAAAKAEADKAEAAKAEAARKQAEADQDTQLNLGKLDDTPLFGDDKQPTDWKGTAD